MRFKWGDLAENVSWCSHASNVLLSRSITSTTQRTWKSYWKQTSSLRAISQHPKYQWESVWNCPLVMLQKIGFYILHLLGLLLKVEDWGTYSAGVDLPPVPISVYMTLKKSFNFSMAEPFSCKTRLFQLLAVLSVETSSSGQGLSPIKQS